MNELERLKMLASAADRERCPRVDVTSAVLGRLRERRLSAVDRTMLFAAAISSAAAVVTAILATNAWRDWQDPLARMLDSVSVVMQ